MTCLICPNCYPEPEPSLGAFEQSQMNRNNWCSLYLFSWWLTSHSFIFYVIGVRVWSNQFQAGHFLSNSEMAFLSCFAWGKERANVVSIEAYYIKVLILLFCLLFCIISKFQIFFFLNHIPCLWNSVFHIALFCGFSKNAFSNTWQNKDEK